MTSRWSVRRIGRRRPAGKDSSLLLTWVTPDDVGWNIESAGDDATGPRGVPRAILCRASSTFPLPDPPNPMPDPSSLALPHVATLHAYTPGIQPTEPGWVKLNTNECPYPPSPRVAEAIRRELGADGASLRLYPNPKSTPLRAAVATLHGLDEANVCIGNGSDDILTMLVRAFCSNAAPLGFTVPSYSLYPVLVEIQDGRAEVIELDRSMRLPVERIRASSSRAFVLTSPNAPTGVGFSNAELEQALDGYHGLLVVDEAYAAFARENAVPLLARHRNLVVVRTLSKAYALAGIRVADALADGAVTDV